MIDRLRDRRLLATAVSAGLAMVALVVAVLVLATVVERNCESIEVLKTQIRPEPFDVAMTQAILSDLGVHPDSVPGKRLIEIGRTNNARERELLAPHSC